MISLWLKYLKEYIDKVLSSPKTLLKEKRNQIANLGLTHSSKRGHHSNIKLDKNRIHYPKKSILKR